MAKYLPHGTTVTFNGSAIGGLVSVSIPDRTKGEAETTDSASVDRTYLPGLRDPGNVELSFRHDPVDVGQIALETNFSADGSGAVKTMVITLPLAAKNPARTYTFDAYVSSPPSGDLDLVADEAAMQNCTIRVAGPVTIA